MHKILLLIIGIHNVSLKNIFVSHEGNDNSSCGNWTSPCRSVRHAVNISAANDVVHIDHFNGVGYEECELHNNTILLDKSLTFTGDNGMAWLSCTAPNYAFFTLHSPGITSKFVFSNVSFICANGQLLRNRNNETRLELILDNIYSNSSVVFQSLFCSIDVKNSTIFGGGYSLHQIQLKCGNIKARFVGSTFNSSGIELRGDDGFGEYQIYDVSVTHCTFESERNVNESKNGPVIRLTPTNLVYKIVIDTSIFRNFFLLQSPESSVLIIKVYDGKKGNALISLDRLVFERIDCSAGTVHFVSAYPGGEYKKYGIDVGIYNSKFINSDKALALYTNEAVKIHNNSFLYIAMDFASPSLIELYYKGIYLFYICNFQVTFSQFISDFTLIQSDSSTSVDYWNISTNFTIVNAEGFLGGSYTREFTVLSSAQDSGRITNIINGSFTVLCPTGFRIRFKHDCITAGGMMRCDMLSASCKQCPRQTYSLERGELYFSVNNDVNCLGCPYGGSCDARQIDSTAKFLGEYIR